MSSADGVQSHVNLGDLRILVICAPVRTFYKEAVARLLNDARLSVKDFKLVTPTDITGGRINPEDFDRILVILTNELGTDIELEEAMLAVAQCGMGMIEIWDENAKSDKMHPAGQKYGIRQIPWDPEKLFQAVVSGTPQEFQSSDGRQIEPEERHEATSNKCGKVL